MKAVLFALNAKYIHSSLAPWCLLAGVEAAGPAGVCAEVREGTVNEPERDVLARILDGEPDAVLFSCYLWNIRETLRLAAAVKAARPGAYVVLGGPEVSYNAGEVLAENPQVDYILSGEGERSVPMLLASLAAGRKPEEAAPPIPGLCARGFLSAPCVEEGAPPSPYAPAYLENLRGRIAYLETSRGCPYACAFCLSGRCGKPCWFPLEQAKRNILTLARSGAHREIHRSDIQCKPRPRKCHFGVYPEALRAGHSGGRVLSFRACGRHPAGRDLRAAGAGAAGRVSAGDRHAVVLRKNAGRRAAQNRYGRFKAEHPAFGCNGEYARAHRPDRGPAP
ncbi:MAG: B12-binding domain-containing radical SAM protein [Ruthenibacterium lactatiformans]